MISDKDRIKEFFFSHYVWILPSANHIGGKGKAQRKAVPRAIDKAKKAELQVIVLLGTTVKCLRPRLEDLGDLEQRIDDFRM